MVEEYTRRPRKRNLIRETRIGLSDHLRMVRTPHGRQAFRNTGLRPAGADGVARHLSGVPADAAAPGHGERPAHPYGVAVRVVLS